MSDWNPSLYLHSAAERSRPAVELLARVPLRISNTLPILAVGLANSYRPAASTLACGQDVQASTHLRR